MNATGDNPPVPPRGAVTPPATFDDLDIEWIAAYAGLSSLVTYCAGEAVESQRRWFGSFQTVQRRTKGEGSAAAPANRAKSAPRSGATFAALPPLAQRGVPYSVTTASIPDA